MRSGRDVGADDVPELVPASILSESEEHAKAENGFGSELWKNLQAVELGPDGDLPAPVRADGREGIVVGVDQVAMSDTRAPLDEQASKPGRARDWWARLTRR